VLKALRTQAFRLRETLALPWREVARVIGFNTGTVLGWWHRHQADGEAGLVSQKPGCAFLSGRALTMSQEGAVHTAGDYLKRSGLSPQRTNSQALEQNPLVVHCRVLQVYPTITKKAEQAGGVIYWADETAVAQDSHWVRGYAPKGHAPVLTASSAHFGLKMVSAVSSQWLLRFELLEGAANAQTTLGFMQRLVRDSQGQKVFLIQDNLRAHHAKDVSVWLKDHQADIEVFYLPPYTPQVNPDEFLTRDFEAQLRGADRSTTADNLMEKAAAFMQFLVRRPERVRSRFQNYSMAYAAGSG
jgi:hypothetical protein